MSEESKRQKAKPAAALLPGLLRLDRATGKLFWKRRKPLAENKSWNARYVGKEALACFAKPGRASGTVCGYHVGRSAVVWALVHGRWPQGPVAHVNGDTFDDRPENLRAVGWGQWSRAARSDNRTGVKGVSRLGAKWRARLKVGGKLVSLGTFDTQSDAAKAVERAENSRNRVA